MLRRPPRSSPLYSSAASDVYKRQILDMWKPWPIRWFDRNVHGGMGIMIDDIVAGVISAGILYFIGHHWPLGILS